MNGLVAGEPQLVLPYAADQRANAAAVAMKSLAAGGGRADLAHLVLGEQPSHSSACSGARRVTLGGSARAGSTETEEDVTLWGDPMIYRIAYSPLFSAISLGTIAG